VKDSELSELRIANGAPSGGGQRYSFEKSYWKTRPGQAALAMVGAEAKRGVSDKTEQNEFG